MKNLGSKLVMIGSALALLPYRVHAQFGNAGTMLNNAAGQKGAGYTTSGGSDTLVLTIGRIVKALIGFSGIIVVVLMIYAGFLWMTAQGDSKNVTKAKDIIKNCIIGLVIVTLAYAITTFVFNRLGCATNPSGPGCTAVKQ